MCAELQDWKENLWENFSEICSNGNLELERLLKEHFATDREMWMEKEYGRFDNLEAVEMRCFDTLFEIDHGETLHYLRDEEDLISALKIFKK